MGRKLYRNRIIPNERLRKRFSNLERNGFALSSIYKYLATKIGTYLGRYSVVGTLTAFNDDFKTI